jgi:hypothetical protein
VDATRVATKRRSNRTVCVPEQKSIAYQVNIGSHSPPLCWLCAGFSLVPAPGSSSDNSYVIREATRMSAQDCSHVWSELLIPAQAFSRTVRPAVTGQPFHEQVQEEALLRGLSRHPVGWGMGHCCMTRIEVPTSNIFTGRFVPHDVMSNCDQTCEPQ